ncbi:unnamed protein product [Durusdinium trenchii]|uniref:Uncharacterized protein n=1 Tax=Durusdinium trenchii TaxID=1381693 RepID=A0ABP0Q6Z4_9DINO
MLLTPLSYRSPRASYLAELSDESLAHAEDRGLVDLLLQDSSAPSTLRDTGSALHDLNGQLPVLASGDGAQSTSYGVRKSKVQQVQPVLRGWLDWGHQGWQRGKA